MKIISLLLILLALAASAVSMLPPQSGYWPYPSEAAIALDALAFLAVLFIRRPAASPRPVAEAARPAAPPPAPPAVSADAEAVGLLALLQERGRFVDFAMDDITGYPDAQVGAAARVVHAGVRAVLQECFRIVPVRMENEGATVQVPAGYAADEYRLVGKIAGQAPFTGRLIHRGWRTEQVKLPRRVQAEPGRLPTIAPAEVELK